jgi:hypothetical protein
MMAIFITYSVKTAKELASLHGYLVPSNDPSPPSQCLKDATQFRIYIGSNIAYKFGNFPLPILSIDQKPMITLDKNDAGEAAVTVNIFDQRGAIVAEIVKNEFTINRNNFFKIIRKDRSDLTVINQQNEEVLNVRYLNPSAIKFRGVFYHPRLPSPVIITDESYRILNDAWIGFCFDGSEVHSIFNIWTNRRPPTPAVVPK